MLGVFSGVNKVAAFSTGHTWQSAYLKPRRAASPAKTMRRLPTELPQIRTRPVENARRDVDVNWEY